MINHRKKAHKSFKQCKNLLDCPFKENCLFNHNPVDENKFICFVCGDEYHELSELMVHRKIIHGTNKCQKFLKMTCNFTAEKCWYAHEDINTRNMKDPIDTVEESEETSENEPVKDSEETHENELVFQDVPVNLVPPSGQQIINQATWIKITSMMTELKQMMSQISQFQC